MREISQGGVEQLSVIPPPTPPQSFPITALPVDEFIDSSARDHATVLQINSGEGSLSDQCVDSAMNATRSESGK